VISIQRLPSSLTTLDAARALLLRDVVPTVAIELPLADALGCIAADNAPLAAVPPHDVAAADGWALTSRDLVGASSYAPLPLASKPRWVEAGDAMPQACDCVLDDDHVDAAGPLFQILGEATPGQGVRRAGSDSAAGHALASGEPIAAFALALARSAGVATLRVRRPRLRLVNVAAEDAITTPLIAELARAAGLDVVQAQTSGRDAAAIAAQLEASCDLLVCIGGSGVGHSDATIAALTQRGELLAHGVALQPGRSAAIGRVGNVPVLALPGAPADALAGWWTLALPLLDRLAGRAARKATTLPLARKLASPIGLAEIVLLARDENAWLPLASGDLALGALRRADAWCAVPAGSEGYAAGTPVDAYMIRNQ
jgi:molybdopterin molybdotransferase